MTTTTAATSDVEQIFLSSTEMYFARFLLTQLCTGLPHFLWLFVWWPRSSESTLESPDSSCRSVAILIWMVPRSSSLSPAYLLLRWTVSFLASGRSSPLCKSPLSSNKFSYRIRKKSKKKIQLRIRLYLPTSHLLLSSRFAKFDVHCCFRLVGFGTKRCARFAVGRFKRYWCSRQWCFSFIRDRLVCVSIRQNIFSLIMCLISMIYLCTWCTLWYLQDKSLSRLSSR